MLIFANMKGHPSKRHEFIRAAFALLLAPRLAKDMPFATAAGVTAAELKADAAGH